MTVHLYPAEPTLSIAVTCDPADDTVLQGKAQSLAQTLRIKLTDRINATHPFLLVYTTKGLELQTINPETKRHAATLSTDFLHGDTGYRRQHGGGIHQPLARAVGIKPNYRPTIVDATAGLGIDGFILAGLGCKVTLIERSPVIWALLADGLERAADHPTVKEITNRIQLFLGNAREIITTLSEQPATIYLDPMYPHRPGSALNKQAMRIIRDLVGDDQDAAALLETALDIAVNRVVVKRPKGAPELNSRRPSHTITMKNSRFDVYLTHNKAEG